MSSGPSSAPIPAPSVLEIDRSKYPFCSPLFEPALTDGFRVQELLDEKSSGRRDLYDDLDVGDDGVADFVYDSFGDSFVSFEFEFIKFPYLTRERFIEMLEKTGVAPSFIEVFLSAHGASMGSPVYSDRDQEKVIAYQIIVTILERGDSGALCFRHDFSTRRTTCLVFKNRLCRLKARFQELFPGNARTGTERRQQYLTDHFLVLSTIAAEYVSVTRDERFRYVGMFQQQQGLADVYNHLKDDSSLVRPSALPSRIKGLHRCNLQLGYFMYTVETKISLVALLQRQHQIFDKFKTKAMIDGPDGNQIRRMKDQPIASQEVSASLDLSASLLDSILSDVRMISRDVQVHISIVQSIVSQFDARTNISIAEDSKRIALDVKKDSVAMKTIAGLTMVFLPGTFTATFFSMVFFHVTDDPEPRLTINKHWWLYVVVTVPLTVLVLSAWLGWLRWKRRGMPKDAELEDSDEE